MASWSSWRDSLLVFVGRTLHSCLIKIWTASGQFWFLNQPPWILQSNNRLKLEHFRVYQLWHFKLSTATVTQTGHISLSYGALLVLLVHQSYGLFLLILWKKKKKINGGFLLSFPFQYFVSCGVFISWVVTNKAHLIETSIYYLKVLVKKKEEKIYWKFHSLTSAAALLQQAAWNEIWLNVFDALSVIKVLGDFISVAVSEGAVSLSLVEWFKVAEWTCWLTGWDSSSPGRASGAYISWHLSSLVCISSPPPEDGRVGNGGMHGPITDSRTASIYKYFFVNTISCS